MGQTSPLILRDTGAEVPGFRTVPRTGVIYVMHRAEELGFGTHRELWSNLGQGAPECGALPGAPPRREQILLPPSHHEYAPIGGIRALRERVAELYNAIYRRGKRSQYTADNVSIAPGGRAAMTRLAAALGEINMGHFLPDYTAYEELLGSFKGFVPIPILVGARSDYRISIDELRRELVGRGLSALLFSNPCNPTGQLVEGEELRQWVELARECRSTLILDEFYSHYIYTGGDPADAKMVSAAEHIEDVDRDPILIVDGLTKNWRYPGWRISWTLGPRDVIAQATSAGSYLDGGANHPFQWEALDLLDPELARQETRAIQTEFRVKREYMLGRLRELGVEIDVEPQGAFYVWGGLRGLPPPLDDGMRFFEAGLEERVITVPGTFFDVNPGKRRAHSRYESYSRFSFGPSLAELERGLDAIGRLIGRHR
ncbi:MAG TPA: pyridoxal phosphate-dependent aminotransferase [Thermoanaerobaculia bacterium]|nr:pyridoxal phosphate-dependent aminotransferase [Thermoanaerobaculia bacterium]